MSLIQTPGKIYLADARGKLENDVHQCFSTFNFANYWDEHKQAFGRLHTFNDEIVLPGGIHRQVATINGYIMVIPITGAVKYHYQERCYQVEAGQILLVPTSKYLAFNIINPYPSDWVNFLLVEIKAEGAFMSYPRTFDFDIERPANQMVAAIPELGELPFSVSIWRFDGRKEIHYYPNEGYTLFGFVIGGAFELQNRLLHERDGLALWNAQQIEAEALSDGAVLLLIELSP